MSQEYTEEKEVALTSLSSGRRVLEAVLVVAFLFAVWLMAALLSFNPSDPSWSQTAWHEPIHNLCGKPGAWLADTLFFIFGIMAYTIPVIMTGGCWFAWRHRLQEEYADYFAVSLRLIGVLALVLTSCGLAAINADDIWYFASGGVIGSLLSTAMMPLLNSSGGTLALLCVWAAGLTLFTGWSWITIVEKLGGMVMGVLTFASNRTRRDDTWQDEEYEDEEHDEYEEDQREPAKAQQRVSRRARILRGALARKQRIAEKFANPVGRKTDEALFSGKRMDDPDEVAPAAPEPDDVLFSGHKATEAEDSDPLLSGYRITAAGTDGDGYAFVDEPRTQEMQPAPRDAGEYPNESPLYPNSHTTYPQDAPVPWGMSQDTSHFDPLDSAPVASAVAEAPYIPATPAADVPVSHYVPPAATSAPQADDVLFQPVHAAPAFSGYDEYPLMAEATSPVASSPEQEIAPEPVETEQPQDESLTPPEHKMARPPLYYFEEVEAKRAREREQLAAWYQPVPDPVDMPHAPLMPPVTPSAASVPAQAVYPAAALIPDVKKEAASVAAVATVAPVFSVASDMPRPQVKEGIGPQLPRPNRVRVPTRRELASFGIKLPSQREAEARKKQAMHQPVTHQSPPAVDMDDDALNEAALASQFAAVQQQRFGDEYQHDYEAVSGPESEDDGSEAEQHALAAQFAASQQQRFGEHYRHDYDHASTRSVSPGAMYAEREDHGQADEPWVSPMKALVDEGPFEPIFMPEPAVAAETAAPPAYHSATQSHAVHGAAPAAAPEVKDSLIHPFLMRNGDDRPLQRPSTPLPSLDLLAQPPSEIEPVDTFALNQMARLVEARLADFRIKAEVVHYSPGPVITRFELNLAPGVKAARISNLSRDLARSLSTVAVRVVEVIPGKPYVGLELPNKKRQTVYLREVLDCQKFRESPSPLTVVLGKDIGGDPVVADLAKMPHLLVAGTTGSGKSVGVNAMILSMLYKATPEEVRFIMIDPKMLELSVYEGIPHLLTEVVTDMKDAANALRWSVNEMERRYKLMSALGVRNLAGYNERIEEAASMGRPIPDPFWKPGDSMDVTHPVLEKLPNIVVLVDEFADLMMSVGKKVEELIARLAQKARAAGIHLVLATQRPSVDVITGLIKANIPTRIAFTVSSKIDSRTILDQGGAESLLGMGDMLYSGPNSTMPVRVHGAFVRDQEVHAVVQDWKARGRPQYVDGITADTAAEGGAGGFDGGEELDPLFDQAVAFVVEKRKASISGVQRQFRIGYNRAARIIEQMENQGIVSEQGHNGNREVLAPPPFE